MTEGEGIVNGKAREPIIEMVADWLIAVYSNLPVEIGKHSWKKAGFEWF
jgi:hypothetical protein